MLKTFEEKNKRIYYQRIFFLTTNFFGKWCFSPRYVLLGLDQPFYIVSKLIGINKYFDNLFGINFIDFLKSTSAMTLIILETYKFPCNIWCMICNDSTEFLARHCLCKSKWDQKFWKWGDQWLFSGILQSNHRSCHLYAITFKSCRYGDCV